EVRSVIQATLMRTTIHMVSGREFWPYAMGIRNARRRWALRLADAPAEADLQAAAGRIRAALAGGPRTVKELDGLVTGFVGNASLWVDLVRVPPSGTWDRRRADRLGLAERWVGPEDATEAEGLSHLVRAYLRAFGPAPWRDIGLWAGITATDARRGGEGLDLVRYRDVEGKELVDLQAAELPDGALPEPDVPAPVRFIAHWDALLLVHARRTGVLPEEHRPKVFWTKNPFSVGTVLVDGRVAAAWSLRAGAIVVEPYEELGRRERDAVEEERAALEAFHA
ncbi:MAG: crosslink repair DNA glycosylase YcaQ family protein, partial [Candidatus Limnocylindrales bacterium]